MTTYIILLRGINVSGKNILKMADLKMSLTKHGFVNCKTYIQSGNITISSKKDKPSIKTIIEEILIKKFNIKTSCFVTTKTEFETMLKHLPFPSDKPKELYFTFFNETPKKEHIENLKLANKTNDQFKIRDKTIYIQCVNGYGKSKLTNVFFENKLGLKATTRNYNTVKKLIELSY